MLPKKLKFKFINGVILFYWLYDYLLLLLSLYCLIILNKLQQFFKLNFIIKCFKKTLSDTKFIMHKQIKTIKV